MTAKRLRVEDDALLRGRGRFIADARLDNQAFGCFVRSPHAHARIVAIDAEAARGVPGVLAVLTAADMQAAGVGGVSWHPPMRGRGGASVIEPLRPALATDRVLHVGQPVALVVAAPRAPARPAIGCGRRRIGEHATDRDVDQRLPRAADLPAIAAAEQNTPATTNPLGVKGVAEAGTTGALAAVMNAIANAIPGPAGARLDMPATPEKVWARAGSRRRQKASGMLETLLLHIKGRGETGEVWRPSKSRVCTQIAS